MPVTVRATDILFNNGTTQNSAGITSAVTSAVAGNGISVSGATGAVTFSAAAPGYNTVGSYIFAFLENSIGPIGGNTYAAGQSSDQVSALDLDAGDYFTQRRGTPSGTWRWMGGNGVGGGNHISIAVRVS